MSNNLNVPVNPTYHEVINDFARKWENNRSERYREYRRKWSENAKNFRLEDSPLHLDIEPTNACNLKCPMCPRTVLINNSNKTYNFAVGRMNIETYRRLIDESVDIGVYSVKLNWLGEPLVHPDIVEMVRYAKDKGIIDVMLNTNAALLTKELAKELIEARLDKIFFSFDSPYKEKYEEIRIGANYEETLNNIKTLVKLREELGKTSPITRVSMVLMDDNKDEYEQYVELFKDVVDVVAYVEYRTPVGEDGKEINRDIKFACSQLWQRMFVSWNGDCIVCCVDSEKEYVVGNIHNHSIREIWKNEKYMNIRDNHKLGHWYKMGICKKCDLPYKKQDGTV